jgi:hypothetical protein
VKTRQPNNTGGSDVKRAEIIAAMCQAARGGEDGFDGESEALAAYKRHFAAKLERTLAQIEPDAEIPTCADFSHLGVECCRACHQDCRDELEILDIECGGRAWICCSLDRVLNPSKNKPTDDSFDWQ